LYNNNKTIELGEDDVKLDVIKKIDRIIREQFSINIFQLSKIFEEQLEKYPEKFV
jgi:hypothetical protein